MASNLTFVVRFCGLSDNIAKKVDQVVDQVESRETYDQKCKDLVKIFDENKGVQIQFRSDLDSLLEKVNQQSEKIKLLELANKERKKDALALVLHKGSVDEGSSKAPMYDDEYMVNLPDSALNFQEGGMEMYFE